MMRALFEKLITFLHFGADVVFPSRCVSCWKPVSFSEYGVCGTCRSSMKSPGEACPRCSGYMLNNRCLQCGDRRMYLDRNIVVSEYAGAMERVLHSFKFDGRKRVGRVLADMAYEAFLKSGEECDMVTSVPANPGRQWKRGYNQSELVAKRLSTRMGRPYVRLLRENRGSGSQKVLRERDRYINILGRFKPVNTGIIRGKTVLIADDIFTTGATLNECARILAENGAYSIKSVSLARAGIKKLENAGI
jgi:competence protein ComFC